MKRHLYDGRWSLASTAQAVVSSTPAPELFVWWRGKPGGGGAYVVELLLPATQRWYPFLRFGRPAEVRDLLTGAVLVSRSRGFRG